MKYGTRKSVILRGIKRLGSTPCWQNQFSQELMVWGILRVIRSLLLDINRPTISVERGLMFLCYPKTLSSPSSSGVKNWSGREDISVGRLTAVDLCCTGTLISSIIQRLLRLPGSGCTMPAFMALSIFPRGSSITALSHIGENSEKWAWLFRCNTNWDRRGRRSGIYEKLKLSWSTIGLTILT